MGCGAGALKGDEAKTGSLSTVVPLDPASSSRPRSSKHSQVEPEDTDSPSNSSPTSPSSALGRKTKQTQRIGPRKSTSSVASGDLESGVDDEAHGPTEEELALLTQVLQAHFLLGGLSSRERRVLIDHMERRSYGAGDVIFNQGDKGDQFFVIQSGLYTVSIDGKILKYLRPQQTFGELALLYNVNRTATVACDTDGVVWSLGEKRFRQCMKKLNGQQISRMRGFLESDPTFRVLTVQEREELAGAGSLQVFHKGELILREGEVGDWLFVILEGSVHVADQHGRTVLKQPGAVIGALGVACTKRQLFSAKAVDAVTCMAIGRSCFQRLSGEAMRAVRTHAFKSLLRDKLGATGAGEESFLGLLFEQQLESFIDNMKEETFQIGATIVDRGDPCEFFVVIDGEVGLIADSNLNVVGAELHLREFSREVLSAGMLHGGKLMVSNTPLQEVVVALSEVRLCRISHQTLAGVLGGPLEEILRLNEIKKALSDIFLFKNLHEDQMDRTIRALKRRRYAAGEVVVQQDEEARGFYLIQSGTITVKKDGAVIRSLGRWDYFGERGLLLQERRSATCEAESACYCLILEDDTFKDIVGSFRRDLEHRMYLQDLHITMSDLQVEAVVGRGTFGIVKLVKHVKDPDKLYALKCVSKSQVIAQRQEKAMIVEREIHRQCYHPCVVQFIKTFQDHDAVYFLTEFLGGGDLFYVIREIGALTKDHSRFFSASIVLSLEYLHGRSIMYRDLKPENVLLDFEGNAKLVDFGCCKKGLRTASLVGTPEYLAPEVILGKGYTSAVDWWSLGVMLHEFVVGPLPFGKDSSDQLELFRDILEAPLQFPSYVVDDSAVTLISGLLERRPDMRVGGKAAMGAREIQDHRYFSGFDWTALLGHYLPPPWVPDVEKLRQNWEMCEGEKLVDSSAEPFSVDPSALDDEMLWTAGF